MNTDKVHHLIILDESGSMQDIKDLTIKGFNEVIQTIRATQKQYQDQAHRITVVSFNGKGSKTHLERADVSRAVELDGTSYHPDANTPLYDAIGTSVTRLKEDIGPDPETFVHVTILTDGLENASRQFTRDQVKELIAGLKKKNWTFSYIGADHDVEKVAFELSVSHKMAFNKDPESMRRMFEKERMAKMRFADRIRKKTDFDGLYDEDPNVH